MKKISISLVMALLLVATLVGCKTTENIVKQSAVDEQVYSYIDIDPLVIGETWDFVITVPYDKHTIELYYRNPDQDAAIQFATLFVDFLGRIPGYSYMINGRINVCRYIVATKSYESTWDELTDEYKAQWKADYKEYFNVEVGQGC